MITYTVVIEYANGTEVKYTTPHRPEVLADLANCMLLATCKSFKVFIHR